jgi:hypothetical protein
MDLRVHVGMPVHEAGSDDVPLGIYLAVASFTNTPDLRDVRTADSDVGPDAAQA